MSEIEKWFFDTFEIKAYYKYLLIDKTTKWHNEKLMDKTNFIDFVRSGKDYLLLKVVKYYPQITDRILLELICILNNYGKDIWACNIDSLRRAVLNKCINIIRTKDLSTITLDRFKHQVQALFKEDN